jgi:N-acetyltransferase 10
VSGGRVLREIELKDPIRYAPGDPIEKWLNDLLCLDALNIPRIASGYPAPQACDLYSYITIL